jgi:hypothetical protein
MTLYKLMVHAVIGYSILAIWVNAPLQRWHDAEYGVPHLHSQGIYTPYLIIDAGMLKVFIPRLSCR